MIIPIALNLCLPDTDLADFLSAYMTTALWSLTDEDSEPLDKNYNPSDFAPETLVKMLADCMAFYGRFKNEIESAEINTNGTNIAKAGHDFWLTRNRHGAGFWDGDWQEPLATTLTDAAHGFGEADLYIGDDEQIYQM